MLGPYDPKTAVCSTFKDWQGLQDVSQPPDEEAAWNAGRIGLQSQLAAALQRLAVAELALGFPIVAEHVKRYEDVAGELRAALQRAEEAEVDLLAENRENTALRQERQHTEKERDTLRAHLAGCVEALTNSTIALTDWMTSYAPDQCGEKDVQETRQRICERGTLAYIAKIQAGNRAALFSSPTAGRELAAMRKVVESARCYHDVIEPVRISPGRAEWEVLDVALAALEATREGG